MTGRAPIERWSRSELEDRFHDISDQVQALKQNNHRMQREMKISKGRMGAGRGAEVHDGPERDQMDELHRSNQVLSQKLKVLKHQLLSYSAANSGRPRPTANAGSGAGSRPSTSATQASRQQPSVATASGQRVQNKQQPRMPLSRGRRPQSAVVAGQPAAAGSRPLPRQRPIAGSTFGIDTSSRVVPASAGAIGDAVAGKISSSGHGGLLLNEAMPQNGWVEIAPPERATTFGSRVGNVVPNSMAQDQLIGEERGDGRLRELQRQGRTLEAENEELRFSLEMSEQKLTTLGREYDCLASEFESVRGQLRSQSDSITSVRDEAQRKTDSSSKSAEISDREVAILREECRALKAAHDRLVVRTLEEQHSGKAALEELARLRTRLEQSSSDSESDRRQWESLVERLRAEKSRLEREMQMMGQRDGHRSPLEENGFQMANGEGNGHGPMRQNGHQMHRQQNENVFGSQSKPLQNGDGHHHQQDESPPAQQINNENSEAMLSKLFTDVMGIVDTHIGGHRQQKSGHKNMDAKANFDGENRWQKMYEDVYEELEKVRRLLLSEHQLNVHLREELSQAALEAESAKSGFEQTVAHLQQALANRGERLGSLERELQAVAAAGDVRDLMLAQPGKTAAGQQLSIESTELSLHLSKLALTQLALDQSQSQRPTVFVAIEFFDFELQTSQLVAAGPEADFDLNSVFDLTVSDLFIHYIQTEGIGIELYIVRDGLDYQLWSQAKIPLSKLLSTRTPTLFRGEVRFLAASDANGKPQQSSSAHPSSSPASQQHQQQQLLLATLAYTVQVPFSLLQALSAQRRRMAATALLPLANNGPLLEDSGMEVNELVIQIHRCSGLERLKAAAAEAGDGGGRTAPSTYLAYEFFHFPVYMSKLVANNGNPVFDDSHSWRLPAGSEAVHKYLLEQDLQIFVMEQRRANDATTQESSRPLAHIAVPLFPLSRNQKIRGSFPLTDRADDSIMSGASIDISIYWKFAYTFESTTNIEPKMEVKRFVPLQPSVAVEEAKKVEKQTATEEEKPKPPVAQKRSAEEATQKSVAPVPTAMETAGRKSSAEDEEDNEEEEEAVLRKLLFPRSADAPSFEEKSLEGDGKKIVKQKKVASDKVEAIGSVDASELGSIVNPSTEKPSVGSEQNKEQKPHGYDPDLDFEPSQQQLQHAIEQTEESNPQNSDISQMESPKSSEEDTGELVPDEELPEDEEKEAPDSARSDATYTAEGPSSSLIEAIAEPRDIIEIRDEDMKDMRQMEAEEEAEPKPVTKPEPAVRRSLLGELPPIRMEHRTRPPVESETSADQKVEINMNRGQEEGAQSLVVAKKSVEFTEPLHSSIPPSELSSSFADDLLSGESAHSSSRSNNSESSTESGSSPPADNSRDSATPTQQQSIDTQNGKTEEKPRAMASRRKIRQRRGKVRRQIDIHAQPTSPAIRVRQQQLSIESNQSDQGGGPAEEGKAIVHIRVGRLRLLEHSPLLHPGYDGGQVFVEWNFLDMARDSCETEGTARLPRHHSQQIHFDQQRAYELNSKRVALLKQWTELNIRLTFTLVLEEPADNGESDDLCMGELDLMEVLNGSQHTLIMRNVDNMAIAVLEVEVEYSEPLIQQIREAIDMAEEEEDESESVVEV